MRFRARFIALTPSPMKMKICFEARGVVDASRRLNEDFTVYQEERPKAGLKDWKPDPEKVAVISKCEGCDQCSSSYPEEERQAIQQEAK